MPTIVGVKLKFAPATQYFDPAGHELSAGQHVIVETERGTEFGHVVEAPHEPPSSRSASSAKAVIRIATETDIDRAADLEQKGREAMSDYRRLIGEHKLDMKPVDVEFMFEGGKIIFYFTAEERVDFRDLVRDLASHFKARIDMRQVGVRDEARMVGGIGHCGQVLCCTRFPGEFHPVSIRMAKEQDLPLNPLKISGVCGRLMCCLRYEYEAYKDFKSRAPKRKAIIETPLGLGKVWEHNTPRETVTLKLESGDTLVVPVSKMSCCKDKGCPCSVSAEALAEIQAVEEQAAPLMAKVPELSSSSDGKRPARQQAPSEKQTGTGEETPRRRSRGGRKRSGGKGGEGEQKKGAAQGAGGQKTGGSSQGSDGQKAGDSAPKSRKSRSRRSRRGGSSGGGSQAQSQPKESAPKQDGGQTASPPARRRRRRRPPQGGQSTENG